MKSKRRQFLKAMGVTGIVSTLPFPSLFASLQGNTDSEGCVIHPEMQETYYIAGREAPVRIMISKSEQGLQSHSLCMEEIGLNDGIPVHKHLNEDELIYIQQGNGVFTLGEREIPVRAGSAAFVPKGVWHGLRNTGNKPLHMLFSFTPSGFEGYFREIGVKKGVQWVDKTAEEFAAINRKYGVVYKR
jgi:mannose-6-phosphate isomerase-like protein (cupin superfamily)